jgi:putative component of membrane protein insertase Oxa1/YidC/SpoIIIJ protein YidD
MVVNLLKILALLSIISASASQASDLRESLSFIRESTLAESAPEADTISRKAPRKRHHNEVSFAFMLLIRVYQKTISSQDLPACNFTQSCSRFAFESIQRHGPIHGIMMASDRLQRCNSFARRYYPIDPLTGLAVDHPVDWYRLH